MDAMVPGGTKSTMPQVDLLDPLGSHHFFNIEQKWKWDEVGKSTEVNFITFLDIGVQFFFWFRNLASKEGDKRALRKQRSAVPPAEAGLPLQGPQKCLTSI